MAEGLDPVAEFCRFVDCARLGRSIETHRIEADKGERRALANRLDILSLDGLKARVDLCRTSDGLVKLKANFNARFVQRCVVALQPVPQELDEEFELFFKEDIDLDGKPVLDVTIEDEFWPEPFDQGRIDIGEAVSQQLALVLDPYPRALGAVFEATVEREIEDEQANPLAGIGKLMPFGRRGDNG